MTPKIDTYITNCIILILRADCSPANEEKRAENITFSITMAAEFGLEEAHSYLVRIADEAQKGRYR